MHGRRMGINDKKAPKKSLLKLGKYLKPYVVFLVIAWILSIVGSVCSVLGPKFLGKITNHCSNMVKNGFKIDLDYIGKIGIILIVFYSISALTSFLSNFLSSGAVQKASKRMRKDISEKINALPLSYFDSRSYGDVLSIVTNDVDTISQNLNQVLNQFVYSISLLIGVLIMMFTTSWILALVTLLSLPFTTLLMGLIMKFSQKYFIRQQATLGQLNGHIEEVYSGHLIVKAFNKEKDNLKDFSKLNSDLKHSGFMSQFLSGLIMPVMMLVGNLTYIAIAVVGGNLLVTKKTSIALNFGDIQSFIMYSRMFNQPIQQIGQMSNVIQSCAAATQRVMEFLDEKELPMENVEKEIKVEDVIGNVTFENIKFGYLPEKEIIHDFSCNVKSGQKVAIVGPTGAGKTTIVNLLMRFYEVNSGKIIIDGVSTSEISRENVASLFGMVLQDTWLFEGTIMENLRYGKKDATYDEVKAACKASHVHHFIKTLPGGYNFVLDENASISQGQKQLLTIARAMIENSPMLILDEATSSVDTRTEILIQEAMDALMAGRTSFVIAHRLSTIKNADVILVMKDGNIIEQGNHDALMTQDGFYKDLYNSQFSGN